MEQQEALEYEPQGFMEKGTDTRQNISSEKMGKYPYNCLLLMIGEFKNRKDVLCVGTAFLINQNYAVTVAHNLWDKESNDHLKRIRIFPGIKGEFNITVQHPQQIGIDKPIFNQEYVKKINQLKMSQERQDFRNLNLFDYALIKLSKPVIRDKYLSISPFIQDYKDLKFEVSGYSGYISTKGSNQAIKEATPKRGCGKVADISSEKGIRSIIQHRIDTSYGQSGAPIMVNINDHYHVIGIHYCHSAMKRINFGIHLDEVKIDLIHRWMKKLEKLKLPPLYRLQDGNITEIDHKGYYFREEESKVEHLIASSPSTCFKFNWQLTDARVKNLLVQGKQVTKITKFQKNEFIHIMSLETLPKVQNCSIKVKIMELSQNGMIWIGIINELLKELIESNQVDLSECEGLLGLKVTKEKIRINGYSWKTKLPQDYSVKIEANDQILLTSYRERDHHAMMVTKQQKVLFKDFFTKEHEFGKDHYLCVILKEKGDSIKIIK